MTLSAIKTSIFNDWDFDTSLMKEEITFDEDVLIYLMSLRRMNINIVEIVSLLQTKQVKYSYINDDDRREADMVRHHYETRYFAKRMSGKELTDYQEIIVRVLRDKYVLFKEDIPALVKLPEFYYFDTEMDNVAENCVSANNVSKELITMALTPVTRLDLKRRSSNLRHYLFTTENKNMAVISLPNTNIDNSFDFMFNKFKTLSLEGYWHPKELNQNFNYIKSDRVTVVDVV